MRRPAIADDGHVEIALSGDPQRPGHGTIDPALVVAERVAAEPGEMHALRGAADGVSTPASSVAS